LLTLPKPSNTFNNDNNLPTKNVEGGKFEIQPELNINDNSSNISSSNTTLAYSIKKKINSIFLEPARKLTGIFEYPIKGLKHSRSENNISFYSSKKEALEYKANKLPLDYVNNSNSQGLKPKLLDLPDNSILWTHTPIKDYPKHVIKVISAEDIRFIDKLMKKHEHFYEIWNNIWDKSVRVDYTRGNKINTYENGLAYFILQVVDTEPSNIKLFENLGLVWK